MISVGHQFTPPRKQDGAAWKKLEWMILNGWRGYRWPTQPKMNLSEVQESLAAVEQARQKHQRKTAAEFNSARPKKPLSPAKAKRRRRAELEHQEEYQTRVLESVAAPNHFSS
ncbi:MAG TPA: hypothetical protein VGB45_08855 [Abditibacterium sp.]|jgi:hypothetical protein